MTEDDFQKLRQFIEENSFRTRLISAGAVVFILIFLFLGFFIPWLVSPGPDWRQDAANIGDMFGLANSFFSGLALLFVVATLFFQTRQHREQVEIGQKTALVQAFTSLIELHHELMKGAPSEFQDHYKALATHGLNRAMDLMKQLGESFDDAPLGYEIAIQTDFDFASRHLRKIRNELNSLTTGLAEQATSTMIATLVCRRTATDLDRWLREYANVPHTDHLRLAMEQAAELARNRLIVRPNAATTDSVRLEWETFWQILNGYVDTFNRESEQFLRRAL